MDGTIVGGVMIAAGGLAAWIGVETTVASVRVAHRTASRATAALEGWDAWFLGGFAGLSAGLRQLASVAAWLAWTLAGACFIGLGTQLVHRW
jgi:hypothetical protein